MRARRTARSALVLPVTVQLLRMIVRSSATKPSWVLSVMVRSWKVYVVVRGARLSPDRYTPMWLPSMVLSEMTGRSFIARTRIPASPFPTTWLSVTSTTFMLTVQMPFPPFLSTSFSLM